MKKTHKFVNDFIDVSFESRFSKTGSDPSKHLFYLFLAQSINNHAKYLDLKIIGDEPKISEIYDDGRLELFPPPLSFYTSLSDQIDLFFGILEEKKVRRSFLDFILRKNCKVILEPTEKNLESIVPITRVRHNERNVLVYLNKYDPNNFDYQLGFSYSELGRPE